MKIIDFNNYYESITQVEAQETLLNMQIAAYPHIKEDDAKKFWRGIRKRAYKDNQKTVTTDKIKEILNTG